MGIHIVDEQLVQRIERIARQERRAEADIIAKALELYEEKAEAVGGRSFLLAVTGIGTSKEGSISEHDEEILAEEIDALRGWSVGDRS